MKKVIVFGSFDPLHKGHLNFFAQAKKLGDYLIVVVARNEDIKKRKRRDARFGEKERLVAVEANRLADRVILGDPVGDYSVLDREKPDVVAIGYDQETPQTLKDRLKQYKIIKLKPYKPEQYKSSKICKGPII